MVRFNFTLPNHTLLIPMTLSTNSNAKTTKTSAVLKQIFNNVHGNKSQSKKFVSKIASFQQFIPHDFDASDHGASSFHVTDVHHIGILDIRILNTDRHAGNLLVRKLNGVGRFGEVELIPIDHGLCLPESLDDAYYEWIHWPQASLPFSEDELEYIQKLDPFRDCELLRSELPMIREACLRVLIICTILLKEAAAFGLCLADIGEMMSREFRCGEEEPSELELVCLEARRLVAEREVLCPMADAEDDEFQFNIDCDEVGFDLSSDEFRTPSPTLKFGFGVSFNGRSPLSKLEESIEDEDEEKTDGKIQDRQSPAQIPKQSKLSMSHNNTSFSEKRNYLKSFGTRPKSGYLANSSSGHKSAGERLPASVSFVEFSDMKEEEWAVFLEKFQELLSAAFARQKFLTLGQKLRLRLGTSCQF